MSKEIPEFDSLKEEVEFWETHDTTKFWDDLEDADDVIFKEHPLWEIRRRLHTMLSNRECNREIVRICEEKLSAYLDKYQNELLEQWRKDN